MIANFTIPRKLIAATLALMLAGCVTLPPEQQAASDQCNYEADKATASNSDMMMGTINSFSLWKGCMAAKGYR